MLKTQGYTSLGVDLKMERGVEVSINAQVNTLENSRRQSNQIAYLHWDSLGAKVGRLVSLSVIGLLAC